MPVTAGADYRAATRRRPVRPCRGERPDATMTPTTLQRPPTDVVRQDRVATPSPEHGADWRDGMVLPLTTALLDVSIHGLSFATPGHRAGRSHPGLR